MCVQGWAKIVDNHPHNGEICLKGRLREGIQSSLVDKCKSQHVVLALGNGHMTNLLQVQLHQ